MNCMKVTFRLTGGSWLNLLKYWTARFTGSDGRLAWLPSESIEALLESLRPANRLKETVHYVIYPMMQLTAAEYEENRRICEYLFSVNN